MKRNKKTGKLNQNQEPVISNEKANLLLDKMLQIVKKYKELGVVVGAVSVCLWNLLCVTYYQGYASRLGVDTQYIQNNNNSLLISVVLFFGSTIVAAPLIKIIFNQMEKNEAEKGQTRKAIIMSLIYIIVSFVLICVIGKLCDWQIAMPLIAMPTIAFAASVDSLIIYSFQWAAHKVSSYKKEQKKAKGDKNANKKLPTPEDDEKSDGSANQIPTKKNNLLSGFCIATIIVVLCAFPLSFGFGMHNATNKNDFKFIVENVFSEILSKGYNLILSETDDYYCLAGYEIEESNGSEIITIKSSRQTIIPKSELKDKVYIVKKRFENAQFVTS